MSRARLATDDQILTAYRSGGSCRAAAQLLGLCPQSVHERLVKLGASRSANLWTVAEREIVATRYQEHADAGTLQDLADELGRTKPMLCRLARRMGLTNQRRRKPYAARWKYMSVGEARRLLDRLKQSRLGVVQWCRSQGMDPNGFARAMRTHFPGEWEHVVEAKVPATGLYRVGRAFEYRTRDDLRARGYFVTRSPASRSPIDLVAIKTGAVLFVQCKRGAQLGVAEWNEVYDLAASVGASPVLAASPEGNGTRYWRLLDRKDGSRRRQPFAEIQP